MPPRRRPPPIRVPKPVINNAVPVAMPRSRSEPWTVLGYTPTCNNANFISDNLNQSLPESLQRKPYERRRTHLQRCCTALKTPPEPLSKRTRDLLERICVFLAIDNTDKERRVKSESEK